MTPWTVACQTPLFMKFSRQEYWSGLLFPSPGIFPTRESNPGLLHCRQTLLPSEPPGKPTVYNTEVKSLSRVRLFATPWTVAHQAPPSMGFSRQEYWSGLLFPSPGIFPIQGLNPGLRQGKQMLYGLSHQGYRL